MQTEGATAATQAGAAAFATVDAEEAQAAGCCKCQGRVQCRRRHGGEDGDSGGGGEGSNEGGGGAEMSDGE